MCRFFRENKVAAVGVSIILSGLALTEYSPVNALKMVSAGLLLLAYDMGYRIRSNEEKEVDTKILRV